MTTPHKDSNAKRIFEVLRSRIIEDKYPRGLRLPAERRLATEFSADRSAVRSALVKLEEAGLIARKPGCRPLVGSRGDFKTPVAVRQGHATANTIAIVLPQHESDNASRQITRAINDVLRSHESRLRLTIFDTRLPSAPPTVLEQEAANAIRSENIAGAIVWPGSSPESYKIWRDVQALGYPIVFVDRYDPQQSCDFVGVDNYTAAKEATEHLIALGHRQIAYLTSDELALPVHDRMMGYTHAVRQAGLKERVWTLSDSSAPRYERLDYEIDSFLDSVDRPSAVFAMSDYMAYRLITLLESRGLSVPERISVIGFDDEDRYSPRPALLTTVRQPFERIGQFAAELLLKRLGEGHYPPSAFQHIYLPTCLIERHTCRRYLPKHLIEEPREAALL